MRIALMFCLLAFGSAALAQDIEGNDTPGNWRVTHHAIFDIWNSICDEREEPTGLHQRCYLRRVEVFSPRPKFAAQFMFITQEADGPKVDFGMEAGTLFAPGAFRIEQGDSVTWRTLRPGCLTGISCTYKGADAESLVAQLRTSDALRFTFRDRHGQPQDLTWPLTEFATALDDFHAQSRARNLFAE